MKKIILLFIILTLFLGCENVSNEDKMFMSKKFQNTTFRQRIEGLGGISYATTYRFSKNGGYLKVYNDMNKTITKYKLLKVFNDGCNFYVRNDKFDYSAIALILDYDDEPYMLVHNFDSVSEAETTENFKYNKYSVKLKEVKMENSNNIENGSEEDFFDDRP